MSEISFFELRKAAPGPPGNKQVKVVVTPVVGTGQTQLGMFDISVYPVASTDQLISVQFIVQYAGEPAGEFTAFILLGNPPVGGGFTATMFAGNDAVAKNRGGLALSVSVVGGVNSSGDPFFVTVTFTTNLWPPS